MNVEPSKGEKCPRCGSTKRRERLWFNTPMGNEMECPSDWHSDSAPVAQEGVSQPEKNRTPDRRAPGFTADDAIVPVVEGVSQPETVGAREWLVSKNLPNRVIHYFKDDGEEDMDHGELLSDLLEIYAAESSRILNEQSLTTQQFSELLLRQVTEYCSDIGFNGPIYHYAWRDPDKVIEMLEKFRAEHK